MFWSYPCAKHSLAVQQSNRKQRLGKSGMAHLHDVPLGLEAPLHAAGNAVIAHIYVGWGGGLRQSSSHFGSNPRASSCVLLSLMRRDMRRDIHIKHSAHAFTTKKKAASAGRAASVSDLQHCSVQWWLQLLTEHTHSVADVAVHPQQAGRRVVCQLLDELGIDVHRHSLLKAVLPIHVHYAGLNAACAARRVVQPAAVQVIFSSLSSY